MTDADSIIHTLGLLPHPEGGHYREIFRAPVAVSRQRHASARSASTAIYFLLRAAEFSAFHRVSSDELWHHYVGDPLELIAVDADGLRSSVLGHRLQLGERPIGIVPANTWQAARPMQGPHGFALCGCTVAPGFDFADFQLATRAELAREFPAHSALIAGLTR
ncbi:MAG TPA: cupin domain-containing protein [Polyangiaceae bacterium]|nr:cupin domain-containing protein [Polyangiaceae bacterium]